MPTFGYDGVDQNGTEETGTLEASSEKLAFETLQARGITVFALQEGSQAALSQKTWYLKDIQFGRSGLSYEDQATVADLMATLFSAGLTAAEVIRISASSSEKPNVKRHFKRVGQRIADGASLANAFEQENRLFSPFFVSFLKISDTTNTLPELLVSLSKFLVRQNLIKQKIVAAIIYPTILVVAAIALVLVVVLYLAPNLEPIFSSVGRPPPATLATLLSLGEFLERSWLFLGGTFICIVAGMITALQNKWIKLALNRVVFRLPLFGKLSTVASLSRLAQSTGLALQAGLPLTDALRISGDAFGQNSLFAALFEDAALSIEMGGRASDVFQDEKLLPASFKELFKIGEETNRLSSTLAAISETMAQQTERQSQRLLSLLTPALTLLLGLGIGFLIYTLMGAILEVNELAF